MKTLAKISAVAIGGTVVRHLLNISPLLALFQAFPFATFYQCFRFFSCQFYADSFYRKIPGKRIFAPCGNCWFFLAHTRHLFTFELKLSLLSWKNKLGRLFFMFGWALRSL